MVAYRQDETARLAQDMPRTDLTGPPDETLPGGLCLGTMDPDRHCIIVAQRAQARDQGMGQARMAPALAQRNCQGIHSTSDEAPGLLAYGEHDLAAHHAPDWCPGQPALRTAVSAPMATTERAAHKGVGEARGPREPAQAHQHSAGDAPEKRGPGRPPKAPVSLEPAEPVCEAARREHERRTLQRAQVPQRLRCLGPADPCVDRERGVRRNGPRLAADIQAHIEQVRAMVQPGGLSQRCWERIEKAERVVPTMPATIAFVSGDVRQQVAQRDVTQPASFALHATRIPSSSLDRVAPTPTIRDGEPLRARAERLRAPLGEPGGALRALRPEARDQLHDEAKRLAAVCQRSSANVEGRNGSWSLRPHQLRGLDLPRKRECCTAMHNFFLTRPDGTTAAERFFGQKPRSMCAVIRASVAIPPAPRSPPRQAAG